MTEDTECVFDFETNGIEKASELLHFHLQSTDFKDMSSSEKSNLVKEILEEVVGISDPIVQQDLIKTLAQSSGVEENQMVHMFSQQIKKKRYQPKTEKSSSRPPVSYTHLTLPTKRIV